MLCGAYAKVLIAAIEQVAKDKRGVRVKAGTRTGERGRCLILDLATSPRSLSPPSRSRAQAECPLFALAASTASVLATINHGERRESGQGKWKMEKADDAAGETQKTNEQNMCRNWQRCDNDKKGY